MDTAGLVPEIKRSERKTVRTSQHRTEAKNKWGFNSSSLSRPHRCLVSKG